MKTRLRCPAHLAAHLAANPAAHPSPMRAPMLMFLLGCLASTTQAQEQLFREGLDPAGQAHKGGYVLREQPALSSEAQDTLQRINAYRAAGATCGDQRMAAAPALAWSGALEQAASKHARDMAARREMSHTGGDGSRMRDRVARESYAWSALGENVSAGYATVVAGLAGWMNSPGHCRNMMSPSFREVGVGAASAPGDTYGWYRAMVLGSPAP